MDRLARKMILIQDRKWLSSEVNSSRFEVSGSRSSHGGDNWQNPSILRGPDVFAEKPSREPRPRIGYNRAERKRAHGAPIRNGNARFTLGADQVAAFDA